MNKTGDDPTQLFEQQTKSNSCNEELEQPVDSSFPEVEASDDSSVEDMEYDSYDDDYTAYENENEVNMEDYVDDLNTEYIPGSLVRRNELPTIPVLGKDGKFRFNCTVCYEEHVIDDGMVCCENFSGEGNSVQYHMVCVGCIRSWAAAAVGEAALAPGGVGLRCVDNACRNVILMSQVEKHLSQGVRVSLAERLQNECIAAAGLQNFITCTGCQVKGTCSETPEEQCSWMECSCGFVQCLQCNLAAHEGKTCSEEMPKHAKTIDDIVLRKCDHCQAEFIKDGGCNEINCRCGKKYCYVCNKLLLPGDDHFCTCLVNALSSRIFTNKSGRCPECKKTCTQFQNTEKLDLEKINELNLGELYTPENTNAAGSGAPTRQQLEMVTSFLNASGLANGRMQRRPPSIPHRDYQEWLSAINSAARF